MLQLQNCNNPFEYHHTYKWKAGLAGVLERKKNQKLQT